MPFTGKATYSGGADLPELVEDVSDIIGIVSPFETPLLDHLGDAKRAALGTVHEWIEDALWPNFDSVNQTSFTPNGDDATAITVANGSRFRVGDQVRPDTSGEVMLVTAVNGNVLTVVRRYGGTSAFTLTNGRRLLILGNAAIEGDDAPDPRFTNRARRANYTQIFSAGVQVSGTMRAVRAYGISDELDYQKQQRLRELLRELENCVINGTAPAANPQGSASVRRTMNGLVRTITTNRFTPGQGAIPAGGGAGAELNEAVLNAALRQIWEQSSARIDTIVVGGAQKRRINAFVSQASRAYGPDDESFRDLVSMYESDYGVCKVVLTRWMPADSVLLLDSTRIDVLPLKGRAFHYAPLGQTGDRTSGMLVGEYTVECRNEQAHGLVRGLTA
jgi:hypothetical protein